MPTYRFVLEPYKGHQSRYTCPNPNCTKGKTFTRYIDTVTGEHIAPHVGKCNREHHCGYHCPPKQFFKENPSWFKTLAMNTTPLLASLTRTPPPSKPSFIPFEEFRKSLRPYAENNFIQYLGYLFDQNTVRELIGRYYIGTSKYWKGATIFWQIDNDGFIRTGKIMLYNPENGKRIKKPISLIQWVHKLLNVPEFTLRQCSYGEHLLRYFPLKPVAIVESEKTAIIASVYLPQFVWIAVGSINNLSEERFRVLQGRDVVFFPDLNAYEKWNKKAVELSKMARIVVSDLLENNATERERMEGLDLADYLIRFPVPKQDQ